MPRSPATSPGAPGTAPQRDVTTAPQTTASNEIRPLHQGVGALHIEGAGRVNPFDSTDTAVADLMQVRPKRVSGVRQAPGFYITPDARPHPQQYHTGPLAQALAFGAVLGTLTYFLDGATVRRVLVAGTGTVRLLHNGSYATAALSPGTGGIAVIHVLDTPVDYEPLDYLGIVVTGATASTPLWVVIGE